MKFKIYTKTVFEDNTVLVPAVLFFHIVEIYVCTDTSLHHKRLTTPIYLCNMYIQRSHCWHFQPSYSPFVSIFVSYQTYGDHFKITALQADPQLSYFPNVVFAGYPIVLALTVILVIRLFLPISMIFLVHSSLYCWLFLPDINNFVNINVNILHSTAFFTHTHTNIYISCFLISFKPITYRNQFKFSQFTLSL